MDRFSVIRSCWGGATLSPAVEPGSQTSTVEEREERLMEVKCTSKTTAQWKPMLPTISEDRPTSYVDFAGARRRIAETGIKNKRVQAKTKSAATAPPRPPPSCHGKDSRKSSPRFILPALSPTPLLF